MRTCDAAVADERAFEHNIPAFVFGGTVNLQFEFGSQFASDGADSLIHVHGRGGDAVNFHNDVPAFEPGARTGGVGNDEDDFQKAVAHRKRCPDSGELPRMLIREFLETFGLFIGTEGIQFLKHAFDRRLEKFVVGGFFLVDIRIAENGHGTDEIHGCRIGVLFLLLFLLLFLFPVFCGIGFFPRGGILLLGNSLRLSWNGFFFSIRSG